MSVRFLLQVFEEAFTIFITSQIYSPFLLPMQHWTNAVVSFVKNCLRVASRVCDSCILFFFFNIEIGFVIFHSQRGCVVTLHGSDCVLCVLIIDIWAIFGTRV